MINLYLGRREQGKTTLARYMVNQRKPRVIFDPRGLVPASNRVNTLAEFHAQSERMYDGERSEIVVTPIGSVQPMFAEVMAWCQNFIVANPTQEFGLLIDELRFVDPKTESFDWILRCSKREITTIGLTAHRPADVLVDVRAIADRWCIFRVAQEHDLKVISERCSPATANACTALEKYHFACWDDTVGKLTIHRDPKSWYLPLTITPQGVLRAPGEVLSVGQAAESELLDNRQKLPLE